MELGVTEHCTDERCLLQRRGQVSLGKQTEALARVIDNGDPAHQRRQPERPAQASILLHVGVNIDFRPVERRTGKLEGFGAERLATLCCPSGFDRESAVEAGHVGAGVQLQRNGPAVDAYWYADATAWRPLVVREPGEGDALTLAVKAAPWAKVNLGEVTAGGAADALSGNAIITRVSSVRDLVSIRLFLGMAVGVGDLQLTSNSPIARFYETS